jgi:serine/threonine-protein kinase
LVGKIIVRTVKTLILIFIIGFTLAFSFWFGHRIYTSFWDIPAEVEVPELVGEDASVADNSLKDKGLALRIIDSQYQEKYPSNTIIRQDPPGGIMVRQGREVLAVISLGPELMDVPNLKGESVRESKIILGNSKLKLGKVTKVDKKDAEPGQVLGQNPHPGEKIKKGALVRLMVNKGQEPMCKVPNLMEGKASAISEKLKDTTLELGTIVWEWNDKVAKGDVIRQIPSPGSMVQPRSKIDIKVSAGVKGNRLDVRQRNLVFFAPKGEGLQSIKVMQVDDIGEFAIYEGRHAPGGKVNLTVYSLGDSEIQVYYNTKLVRRIRI